MTTLCHFPPRHFFQRQQTNKYLHTFLDRAAFVNSNDRVRSRMTIFDLIVSDILKVAIVKYTFTRFKGSNKVHAFWIDISKFDDSVKCMWESVYSHAFLVEIFDQKYIGRDASPLQSKYHVVKSVNLMLKWCFKMCERNLNRNENVYGQTSSENTVFVLAWPEFLLRVVLDQNFWYKYRATHTGSNDGISTTKPTSMIEKCDVARWQKIDINYYNKATRTKLEQNKRSQRFIDRVCVKNQISSSSGFEFDLDRPCSQDFDRPSHLFKSPCFVIVSTFITCVFIVMVYFFPECSW